MTILVIAIAVVTLRVVVLWVRPYKACGVCKGRGHCVRCGYKGKVLRAGARWVHPELKKEK